MRYYCVSIADGVSLVFHAADSAEAVEKARATYEVSKLPFRLKRVRQVAKV